VDIDGTIPVYGEMYGFQKNLKSANLCPYSTLTAFITIVKAVKVE
jgi:hypothetical protein